MMTDGKDYQVMESCEADFEKLTWSFTMRPNQHVSAGNFAIVPVTTFVYWTGKLAHAEGLLRAVRDTPNAPGLDERVAAFFDPAH